MSNLVPQKQCIDFPNKKKWLSGFFLLFILSLSFMVIFQLVLNESVKKTETEFFNSYYMTRKNVRDFILICQLTLFYSLLSICTIFFTLHFQKSVLILNQPRTGLTFLLLCMFLTFSISIMIVVGYASQIQKKWVSLLVLNVVMVFLIFVLFVYFILGRVSQKLEPSNKKFIWFISFLSFLFFVIFSSITKIEI